MSHSKQSFRPAARWKGRGSQHATNDGTAAFDAESDSAVIKSLNGPYKFLSNFSWGAAELEGIRYPSVEHAFQAAKLRSNSERQAYGFADESLSFGEAKRLGRRVPLREDWKDIREEVMAKCLESKFQDPALRQKLLATGNRQIIDGHSGSPDLIWGYHFPSQAGENRLGILLMKLRSKLHDEVASDKRQQPPSNTENRKIDYGAVKLSRPNAQTPSHRSKQQCALYHLDWPWKCLHDGLPASYAENIARFARDNTLVGKVIVLPRRKICIAVYGNGEDIDAWEHTMRTESVDVNSRGRPCRERMLVGLARCSVEESPSKTKGFVQDEADSWNDLCTKLAGVMGARRQEVEDALGPEPPELPRTVEYAANRTAVILDGKRFALCLNDHEAIENNEDLCGMPHDQTSKGPGLPVPLKQEGRRPNIFGGKFARSIDGLLSVHECQKLIDLSEGAGYGLAGSRGFNPFARFALRCLIDAPLVAEALTCRLSELLPQEYPPGSGRRLVGMNERCRFLKYLPGMHHSGDHTDCAHEDPKRGRSFLTLQLYLNDSFQGGRTTFVSDRLVPVEPSPGKAVIFDHELYHRGGTVTQGIKYAIRMDVLYSPPTYNKSNIDRGNHHGTDDGRFAKSQLARSERRQGRWSRTK